MADNTPYHSFNRFDKLESWDYNPDFEKLDARLELRGAAADRPSSAPDGAKYVVDNPSDADHGAVYIYDSGTSTWNKQPVNTDQINNADYYVDDSTSVTDINSLLSTAGRHIALLPGDHILDDRIEFGAADVTLTLKPGATVKVADGATPTLETDNGGSDHLITIINNGFDGCVLRHQGVINANDSSHGTGGSNAGAFGVQFKNAVNCHIDGAGGNFADTHVPVNGTDCDGLTIENIYSDGHNDTCVGLNGCRKGTAVHNVVSVNGGEAVDLNGANRDIEVSNLTGVNVGDNNEVLDINGSPGTSARGIRAINCESNGVNIVKIASGGSGLWSSRTADKTRNDHTISDVRGTVGGEAIRVTETSQECKNLTLANLNVGSNSYAVSFENPDTGTYEDIYIHGRIKAKSFQQAIRLGRSSDGGYGSDVELDVTISAPDSGGVFVHTFDNVSGVVRSHNVGGTHAVRLLAGTADHDLRVNVHDNADHGVTIESNNTTIRGTAIGHSVSDVNVTTDATDTRLDVNYSTLDDAGTNTLVADYSAPA